MILSKYFVFIHSPKTGGSFVKHLCKNYAPPEWKIRVLDDYHLSIYDIPEEYKHLPVFGFVRNPFDWYVSWYSFFKATKNGELFNNVSNNGSKSFKETLISLNKCRTGSPILDLLYRTYGTNSDAIIIGKFENLREELLKIVKSIVKVPEELEKQILIHPKVNQSQRKHYRDYYDEELRSLVSKRDKIVLDYFDYKF